MTHKHTHTHTNTHTLSSVHWIRPPETSRPRPNFGLSPSSVDSPADAHWSIGVSYYCWWCSRWCACAGRCSTIRAASCTDCPSSLSIVSHTCDELVVSHTRDDGVVSRTCDKWVVSPGQCEENQLFRESIKWVRRLEMLEGLYVYMSTKARRSMSVHVYRVHVYLYMSTKARRSISVHVYLYMSTKVPRSLWVYVGNDLKSISPLWPLKCRGITNNRFFLAGPCFLLVTVKKKEGSNGGRNSLRKQETGTEKYGNSTCFPMFPKHVPKTLKNPSLTCIGPRLLSKLCLCAVSNWESRRRRPLQLAASFFPAPRT